MKKYLIILITASLFLTSCNDMLNLMPTTSITGDFVWQDSKLIEAYQTELYLCLPHEFGHWDWMSQCTDEVFNNNNVAQITNGTLTEDNVNGLENCNLYIWNSSYQYLRRINIFLDEVEKTNISLPNKDRLIAEVKGLKAYIYFNLISRFGGVPIVNEYWGLNEASEKTFTSNTFDECVTEIEKLIAEALPNLQEYYLAGDPNFGRITQDVCRAMLSRMYLYVASPLFSPVKDNSKWQKAANVAKDFMDKAGNRYELYPDYGKTFNQPTGAAIKEYIFTRNYTSNNGHNAPMDNLGRRYGAYGGWWASNGPSQNLVDDYDMKSTGLPPFIWENGVKTINPASGYDPQNPYNDRDPRFYATVIHDGAVYRDDMHEMWVASDGNSWGYDSDRQSGDNPRGGYILRKFMPDLDQTISWNINSTIPWPRFRLAEIYLNYAEAMFELGNEVVCREYMNKIRARVEMPDIPATVTGDELRQRLYNERRVEFAFEQHRYFDVRRWKIANVTENRPIYGILITKDVQTGVKTYTPRLLLDRTGLWNDKYYLLPIYSDEIRRNKGTLLQTVTWR